MAVVIFWWGKKRLMLLYMHYTCMCTCNMYHRVHAQMLCCLFVESNYLCRWTTHCTHSKQPFCVCRWGLLNEVFHLSSLQQKHAGVLHVLYMYSVCGCCWCVNGMDAANGPFRSECDGGRWPPAHHPRGHQETQHWEERLMAGHCGQSVRCGVSLYAGQAFVINTVNLCLSGIFLAVPWRTCTVHIFTYCTQHIILLCRCSVYM